MKHIKRLIEVDMPIRTISEQARREKDMRKCHVPMMYIWPATRPPAACRAVICASLWPDPADEKCPPSFVDLSRKLMLSWINGDQSSWSSHNFSYLNNIRNMNDLLIDDNYNLRKILLLFISEFSNFDNSTNPSYLKIAQSLTKHSHICLGQSSNSSPLVLDPFAGGGAIPIEALRVGADTFGSDLNPIAILHNKVVASFIPKFFHQNFSMEDGNGDPIELKGLVEAINYWGNWLSHEVSKELAHIFPTDDNGDVPIAYLWARTIISEAPDDGTGIPIEVPLLKTMWLARNKNTLIALRWKRDAAGNVITNTENVQYSDGKILQVRRPQLEIFHPEKQSEVGPGTSSRSSATCPVSNYTTPASSVRKQLIQREGGANDARLYCVVTSSLTKKGRTYRLPNIKDDAIFNEVDTLYFSEKDNMIGIHSAIPDEVLPTMSGVFNAPLYGHATWSSLFTRRQQLVLSGFSKKIHSWLNQSDGNSKEDKRVIASLLAILVNKLADLNSSLCAWQLNTPNAAHTFTRWAIPMVMDFAEVNPFAQAGGSPKSILKRLVAAINYLGKSIDKSASIELVSASHHVLPDDCVNAFITDPPYYNAVPYADLSDYFYIWSKRALQDVYPDLFGAKLSPKEDEICEMSGWDPVRYKHKDSLWYEKKMKDALSEGRRVLAPNGIGVIVFAHKSTQGWESMLQAVIDAGWIVTASWPIDTEMASRLRAKGSAVLSSSIHLVCRPREKIDGSLITDHVGDWREVLSELPKRIHEWMPRLSEEGIVGADAIFACLGPALEIFSQFSEVEKASGELVTLSEYLVHIWAAVAKEALNMIFEGADTSGFEEDARLTAMWLWTLNANTSDSTSTEVVEDIEEDDEGSSSKSSKGGFSLEFDAARKIAQGLGAHLEQLTHLVEVKGSEARLLPVSERGGYLFGKQPTVVEQVKGKKTKAKSKQANIFELFDSTGTDSGDVPNQGFTAEVIAPDLQLSVGKSILDRVHQCMILFVTGQSDTLRRFLVEEGIGRDERFWKLAQALSALYPQGTDEKRWVDGVLARKKGLGF